MWNTEGNMRNDKVIVLTDYSDCHGKTCVRKICSIQYSLWEERKMWNTEGNMRNDKVIVLTDYSDCHGKTTKISGGSRKLSRTMAVILGVAVTIEIMIAGAMIFNIDFHSMDGIALLFAFMVLYFGVVAGLTDK